MFTRRVNVFALLLLVVAAARARLVARISRNDIGAHYGRLWLGGSRR